MKLARKLTLSLLVALCAVLALHAWLQAQREVAFYEADARRDDRFIGTTLAAAFDKTWSLEGRARAMALVEEVNAHPGPVRVRWVAPEEIPSPSALGAETFRLDAE